jgi:hypothetical protein
MLVDRVGKRRKRLTYLAQVVVAEEVPAFRRIWTVMLERRDHTVFAPRDFWGVLAVLRVTLHPVVVIYGRDTAAGHLLRREERLAALEANREALFHHRYVAMGWLPYTLPPRLAAIEESLVVEKVLAAFDPDDLDAAVARAVEWFPQ